MKTVARPINPFPKELTDEASGIPYIDERWKVWEQCREAMDEYYREALRDPISLLMSAEGGLVRMKDMAQGDLWSGLGQTLALVSNARGQIGKAVNEKEG